MKKELSALEINYLIKEFKELVNSKVDSIFQPQKDEILIQLFIPGKGKKILRILPNFIYLTETKKQSEQSLGFGMNLRKHLINSRLRSIKQIDSERILEILFETKDHKYYLMIELFCNGNIILCNQDKTIITLLKSHKWKDRELKPKIKYITPPKKLNFLETTQKETKKILNSDKQLVKKLATDIGLGGIYAEEICLLTNIDKNKEKLDEKEVEKLTKELKNITNKKTKPFIVYKEDKIIDITPFQLQIYKDFKSENTKDYNSAIDLILTKQLNSLIEDKKTDIYEKKIEKVNLIIENQKEKIEEMNNKIGKDEKKAELIYNNYNIIKEIIKEINKAKQKYDWKQIKEKLKGHKIIKEVNSKEKTIILELK